MVKLDLISIIGHTNRDNVVIHGGKLSHAAFSAVFLLKPAYEKISDIACNKIVAAIPALVSTNKFLVDLAF